MIASDLSRQGERADDFVMVKRPLKSMLSFLSASANTHYGMFSRTDPVFLRQKLLCGKGPIDDRKKEL